MPALFLTPEQLRGRVTELEAEVHKIGEQLIEAGRLGQALLDKNRHLEKQLEDSEEQAATRQCQIYELSEKLREVEDGHERTSRRRGTALSALPGDHRQLTVGSRRSLDNQFLYELSTAAEEWEEERKELESACDALKQEAKRFEKENHMLQRQLDEFRKLEEKANQSGHGEFLDRSRRSRVLEALAEPPEDWESLRHESWQLGEELGKSKANVEKLVREKSELLKQIQHIEREFETQRVLLEKEKTTSSNLEFKLSELENKLGGMLQTRQVEFRHIAGTAMVEDHFAPNHEAAFAGSLGAELTSVAGALPQGLQLQMSMQKQAEGLQQELVEMRHLMVVARRDAIAIAHELEAQAIELQRERDTLRKRVAEMEDEMAKLHQHVEATNEDLVAARKREHALEQQEQSLQAKATELEEHLAAAKSEAEGLQKQFASAKEEADQLRSKTKGTQAEAKEVQSQLSGIKAEAREAQAQLEVARAEVSQLTAQLQVAKKALAEAQAVASSAKQMGSAKQQEDEERRTAMEKEVVDLRKQLRTLQEAKGSQAQELSLRTAAAQEAAAAAAAAERRREAAEQQCEELRRQLARLQDDEHHVRRAAVLSEGQQAQLQEAMQKLDNEVKASQIQRQRADLLDRQLLEANVAQKEMATTIRALQAKIMRLERDASKDGNSAEAEMLRTLAAMRRAAATAAPHAEWKQDRELIAVS